MKYACPVPVTDLALSAIIFLEQIVFSKLQGLLCLQFLAHLWFSSSSPILSGAATSFFFYINYEVQGKWSIWTQHYKKGDTPPSRSPPSPPGRHVFGDLEPASQANVKKWLWYEQAGCGQYRAPCLHNHPSPLPQVCSEGCGWTSDRRYSFSVLYWHLGQMDRVSLCDFATFHCYLAL